MLINTIFVGISKCLKKLHDKEYLANSKVSGGFDLI